MTRLGDRFEVRRRFFRSVHLATDALRPEASDGYVLTPLGRSTLERILDGVEPGRNERAWSLTGPYGAGKSAFVVLLAQLLGAGTAAATSLALQQLHGAHRALERRVLRTRGEARGFITVLVTGTYGPLLPSLLEAVENAVQGSFHKSARKQALLDEVRALRSSRAKPTELHRRVVKLFADLAQHAVEKQCNGLLVIVDELGKCLDYAARGPGRADEVFLLQELAEAASRSAAQPIVFVTLLHQALDRYARDLASEIRDEWAKVQGRFEDVAFLDAPGELLRLAGRTLQRRPNLPAPSARRYDALADEAVALGLAPEDQLRTLRDLAPLHPTVALLLPPLFRGPLSQNERSLFGFLTAGGDGSFGAFLAEEIPGDGPAPSYTIDRLYDYVAATLGPAQYTLSGGRRWAAIDEALARLPSGEPELSARLVKAIGLLSLLGSRSVRASKAVLCFALAEDGHSERDVAEALARLSATSQVVYRRHSDAYALWEGSDVDLDAHFDTARAKTPGIEEIASRLGDRLLLRPWVARRHFIETGTLRYFSVTFRTQGTLAASAEADGGEADGRIVYLLPEGHESHEDLIQAATQAAQRSDVVLGVPREAGTLLAGAKDWFAWENVRATVGALAHDAVARRELSARSNAAADRLEGAVQSCYGLVDGAKVSWLHQGARTAWTGARELSAALSAVCDQTFAAAPRLRNELLNRRQLSSAAAAARRSLLDAMLTNAHLPRLGIEGTPPEASMYASVLFAGGIHRERDGAWGLGAPPENDPLRLGPAWRHIEAFLDETESERRPLRELFDALARPPIGLREGPSPVLFFAVVLSRPGEVALFEDGTFVPEITGAVVERLLRRIEHFEVARFRLDEARTAVLHALARALGLEGQGARPMELTRAVVRRVSQLPRYSRNTRRVGAATLALRDAILAAREPLRLLFRDLPAALGVDEPVEADATVGAAYATVYAERLTAALDELAAAHPALLGDVEAKIAHALGLRADGEGLRAALAHRARHVTGLAVDLRLKAFLGRALETQAKHAEWLEGLAMVIGNRPPSEWNDGELARFDVALEEIRALFVRAEDLALARAPDDVRDGVAVAGAQQEIMKLLEGRLGPERDVWLAALRGTLRSLLDAADGGAP